MSADHVGQSPFVWGVGIENTNIGWPLAASPEGLDEYELTAHYAKWESDLELAASIGATAVRYGLPWYRVNPARGVWDWEWSDDVFERAGQLGLAVIVDLVHYGTPRWLAGSFADPDYPEAVAQYAGAVAARYHASVKQFTPLNEPLVTASFAGARGIWPPHLSGDEGWASVVASIAEGIQLSIHAIRKACPDAGIVHVEATHIWLTSDGSLADEVALRERMNFLPTDLVLGLVDHRHPMRPWLLENGIEEGRLSALEVGGTRPDVIGLNYYPELSARELVRQDGRIVGVARDAGTSGLRDVIQSFTERYGLPILVSETGVEGSDDHRVQWLDDAAHALHEMRAEGVDVRGLVWWPLFDFVDWSWATGDQVIEEFYSLVEGVATPVYPPRRSEGLAAFFRRMGLHRLEIEGGDVRRVPTAAAERFRLLATGVGDERIDDVDREEVR